MAGKGDSDGGSIAPLPGGTAAGSSSGREIQIRWDLHDAAGSAHPVRKFLEGCLLRERYGVVVVAIARGVVGPGGARKPVMRELGCKRGHDRLD